MSRRLHTRLFQGARIFLLILKLKVSYSFQIAYVICYIEMIHIHRVRKTINLKSPTESNSLFRIK